jgi:hypothetical protein
MLRMNGEQWVHSAHGETCRTINPFHRFVFVLVRDSRLRFTDDHGDYASLTEHKHKC